MCRGSDDDGKTLWAEMATLVTIDWKHVGQDELKEVDSYFSCEALSDENESSDSHASATSFEQIESALQLPAQPSYSPKGKPRHRARQRSPPSRPRATRSTNGQWPSDTHTRVR